MQKETTLLGIMRYDFTSGELSNKWIPHKDICEEDRISIQSKINIIMYNKYNTLKKIIEECGGTGYNKEKILYEESEKFLYAIKLIPVIDNYNGYIYVYRK